MKTFAFLRQYVGLITLVCLLVLAFLIKNAQNPVSFGDTTNVTAAERTPIATKAIKDSPAKKETRSVSSANAAASISHAFESSFRPKVVPLPDFSAITDVKQKKALFFNYLTELANAANNKVVHLRVEIKRMKPGHLTTLQVKRLNRLAKSYKIKTKDPHQQMDLLLRKIEEVPTALVLAQAANESAWGTSRFATQGNNLFGQWCFSNGCGLVPSGRPEGETYEVRKFKDPQESVDAYIRNLNSHGSYLVLRRIRECLIDNHETVTARALSSGLISYSSRGVDYIDDIRSMIRVNRLEPWAKNWWGNDTHHPCSELVKLERPDKITDDPIHGVTVSKSN
ncbi:MAG: glucosaminidase domain-containing protein [Gammaproteobacteria bacterium]|nr:glucosaminidase domain-containing protein [Gammaproteobacteria bacterium]